MSNTYNKYFQIYNELKALNTEKQELSHFFKVAKDAAGNSTCGRKHVGAAIFYWPKDENKLLYKKGQLLGIGHNGYKESTDETRYGKTVSDPQITCAEQYRLLNLDPDSDDGRAIHLIIMKEEIHAEDRAIQNAIKQYGKEILKDSIIFTTLSPCENCSKMINSYGIAVGGWLEKYNRDGGKGIRSVKKILLNNKVYDF